MGKKKKQEHNNANATPALQILNDAKIQYELYEYSHNEVMEHGFALDTAKVLQLDPRTVFKTLLVELNDGSAAVGVVPACGKLNLKSIAKALSAKHATMMDPVKAERVTGYIKGGISPIGQKRLFPTVIDESACDFATILVSGGKRSLSVQISATDLATVCQAKFASISEK